MLVFRQLADPASSTYTYLLADAASADASVHIVHIGSSGLAQIPVLREMITTAQEQGIDVTSGEGWTGMWARAGTPATEIERMQKAIQQVLQMPEVREQMAQRLWVQPHYRNGADMDKLQRAELVHWEPIIKASGFKAE